MKKLNETLPWDFNFTNGGIALIVTVFLQELMILYWLYNGLDIENPLALFSILPSILLAIELLLIGKTGGFWWHFVGTDVICRDSDHQRRIELWAKATKLEVEKDYTIKARTHINSEKSREYQHLIKGARRGRILPVAYNVRFKNRDMAILAKLAG